MRRTYRRPGGLAVLVAAAAVGLAACGGGSSTPQVASLGTSSGNGGGSSATPGTSTAALTGNPTRLLNEWAACMRSHGDPGQTDPTIDASKVIHIALPSGVQGGVYGTEKGGKGNFGPGQFCRAYLNAAQTALRGGEPRAKPDLATLEKYSECMRANGILDFPDPTASGLVLNRGAGGDLNPDSPAFRNASNVCAKKTGAHVFGSSATPPPGTVMLAGAGEPGGGSGGNG